MGRLAGIREVQHRPLFDTFDDSPAPRALRAALLRLGRRPRRRALRAIARRVGVSVRKLDAMYPKAIRETRRR